MVENGGAYPMYILDFCNFSASSSKARSGLFTRTGFFYNLKRGAVRQRPVFLLAKNYFASRRQFSSIFHRCIL